MPTTTWANTDTVVSKLTLRGKRLDTLVAPQRLTHLLQTVDLHPPGFPPDAILCIRRYRTRIPASWTTHSHTVLPSLEWQRIVQSSIDQLRHRAVRPLYEAVPPSAEAVLFADRAELLACVARDWCDRTLTARWWWQSLFPQQGGDAAFLHAWQESPEYIPSALQSLVRIGQMVAVMQRLSSHETRRLSQLLERTFGLSTLAQLPLSDTGQSDDVVQTTRDLPDMLSWNRWVPEFSQGRLTVEQQRFVGVGLMLHRAPSVVRSSDFASSFQRWYRAVAEDVVVRSRKKDHGLQGLEEGTRGERLAMEETAASHPSLTPHSPAEVVSERPSLQDRDGVPDTAVLTPHPPAEVVSERPSLQDRDGVLDTAVLAPHPPAEVVSERPSLQDRGGVPGPSVESIMGREPAQAAPERTPIRPGKAETVPNQPNGKTIPPELTSSWPLSEGSTIHTERGGVFYLINVGLFLDLYGDFSQPLRPGLTLPIWDFLALVGERLVGTELSADPIWPLLGRLAGREEGHRPGATFNPPTDWHLPHEWLRGFSTGAPWRWTWAQGRLLVWHSAGFPLVDCAMEDEPSSQDVSTLLQDYRQDGELVRVDRGSSMHSPEPLDRWLTWLLPYLRARLARALAPDGVADWPAVLINHRATITVTDTRLDVTFSLNQHPLAIRIAGLDRDPGWVPAAGRWIAFHYQVP